jgi:hypothetical protein
VVALIVGLGLVAWGIYLLRGRGPGTKSVATKAQATTNFEAAVEGLRTEVAKNSSPRADLVTAFLVAQEAGNRLYGAQIAPGELSKAFAHVGFSMEMVSSPLLGQVPGVSVHRDWIIAGPLAYDMTASTRAQFHLDDRVQTVTTSKNQGKKVVSTAVELPRGGQLQIVSADGSRSYVVGPNQVSQARQLAEQINVRAEQIKDAATTAAHGRTSVEAEQIRAIANPETAQALQNLQNLLFTRVISDEEFARMKAKVLGDPGAASASAN